MNVENCIFISLIVYHIEYNVKIFLKLISFAQFICALCTI